MLSPAAFLADLKEHGISFFAGVPDSLLKNFLSVLPETDHVICANEGSAVAVAAGYHLSSGRLPLVYMQNSGLGNAINPLLSLVHSKVYAIPLLLMIGWRGQPESSDEPQHQAMGELTTNILNTLGISYTLLTSKSESITQEIASTIAQVAENRLHAYLISPGTFSPSPQLIAKDSAGDLTRSTALEMILSKLTGNEVVVCTTGYTSRELYEYRQRNRQNHRTDFLNVGAMGHALSIAFGIALNNPHRTVLCLDGDGSALMHMGAMAVAGSSAAANLKHIVLNNGVHDSVGGQPTVGFDIDFTAVAHACGYQHYSSCMQQAKLSQKLNQLLQSSGPAFLEIRIKSGTRTELSRPAHNLQEFKQSFMDFLQTPVDR